MKTLGQFIRELRQQRELSLRELARRAGGLSAAFLSDVELGRRFPSQRVLANLARALDVPIEELAQYDTRPPVDELKRLAMTNPAFGQALRKLVDRDVSPEDLIALADQRSERASSH
ncbi:MAG TPA: helix-turn-helix transcriptional regulator [Vicinamibacterales bacterium]